MSDQKQTTATETTYIRKWPDAAARDRGEMPAEIVVATQVSVLDGAAIVASEPEVEIATEPARIAELNPHAIAAEERAQLARKGAE